MSIKKLLVLLGLSCLFAGCSTGKYGENAFSFNGSNNKTMGTNYLLGRGVAQDNEKAFYYFSKAANAGDPFSQNEVAYMYAAGKGTERNPQQAVYWYQKAAGQGLASAQYNLGFLYLHGIGTAQDRAKATEWFEKSAKHGFGPAQSMLEKMKA
jgi:TPR repeat protein